MNLVTFVAARLLGIIVGDDKVANLVDPGPEFDKLSEVASSGNIFSPCLQQMRLAMESQPQPPTITTARIVNVERTQLGDRMSSAIPAPALFTSFLAMNHGEALSPDSTKHDESSLLLKSPAATAVAHELSHTAKVGHQNSGCSPLTLRRSTLHRAQIPTLVLHLLALMIQTTRPESIPTSAGAQSLPQPSACRACSPSTSRRRSSWSRSAPRRVATTITTAQP